MDVDAVTVVPNETPSDLHVEAFKTLANLDRADVSRPVPKSSDLGSHTPTLPTIPEEPTIIDAITSGPSGPADPPTGGSPTKTYEAPIDENLMRQQKLSVLRMYKESGIELSNSFEYYDSAPLAMLDAEINSVNFHNNARQFVPMIWSGLCTVVNVIETQNRKLGPILPIDGWTSRLSSRELEARPIVHRLFMKYASSVGQMGPEMAMVMLLASTATPFGNAVTQALPTRVEKPPQTPMIVPEVPIMRAPNIESRPRPTPVASGPPMTEIKSDISRVAADIRSEVHREIHGLQSRTDAKLSEVDKKLDALLRLLSQSQGSHGHSSSDSDSTTSEE